MHVKMFDMTDAYGDAQSTGWITKKRAAQLLGVGVRQVERYLIAGILTAYLPEGIAGERPPVLIHAPQAGDLARARARLKRDPTVQEMREQPIGAAARAAAG